MNFNLNEFINNSSHSDLFLEDYIYDKFNFKNRIENPLTVTYSIESLCNLNCKHCWDKFDNKKIVSKRPNRNMIEQALQKLKKLHLLRIVLTGGEPFLRKDIFSILKSIKEKNFSITILTNGTLLNKEQIKTLSKILNTRTDIIQVSIDGLESSNNIQRGKDIFFSVIENVKYIIQLGIKVRIHTVITEFNISDIEELYNKMDYIGVYGFSVSPVYGKNRGIVLEKNLNYRRYLEVIRNIKKQRKRSNSVIRFEYSIPIRCFEFFTDEYRNEYYVNNETTFEIKDCLSHIRIDIHGNIFSGKFSNNKFYLGNIYETSYVDINTKFLSEEFLVRRDLSKTKCSECTFIGICKGGDLIRTYEKFNSLNYPDPDCVL